MKTPPAAFARPSVRPVEAAGGRAHGLCRRVPAGLLLLALAGCNVIPPPQTDPTRYFILSPSGGASSAGASLADGSSGGAAATAPGRGGEGPDVGFRLSVLPGYLDGRHLIVRTGPNEISIEDYSLWAEPLASALRRCVADELAGSGRVGRVVSPPGGSDRPRACDLTVEVLRCGGAVGADGRGTAEFSARITVTNPADGDRIQARTTYVAPPAAWDGHDFGALAGLLSNDAAGLARALAGLVPSSTAQ